MALPQIHHTIPISDAPLDQARQSLVLGNYVADRMAQQGGQMLDALNFQLADSEAKAMAPHLQQAYGSAFQNIVAGNVPQGIAQAMTIAAQSASNPLLQRINQQGMQAAGILSASIMDNMRTQIAGREDRRTQFQGMEIRDLQQNEAELADYEQKVRQAQLIRDPQQRQQYLDNLQQPRMSREEIDARKAELQGGGDYGTSPDLTMQPEEISYTPQAQSSPASSQATPYDFTSMKLDGNPVNGTADEMRKRQADQANIDPSQFETKLTPQEEEQFQKWKQQNAPNDSGQDYDFRGAFKAGLKKSDNGHWPDTYKKPNHPTFSDQSIYASKAPNLAGKWDGDKFVLPGSKAQPQAQQEAQDSVTPLTADQDTIDLLGGALFTNYKGKEQQFKMKTTDRGVGFEITEEDKKGLPKELTDELQSVAQSVSAIRTSPALANAILAAGGIKNASVTRTADLGGGLYSVSVAKMGEKPQPVMERNEQGVMQPVTVPKEAYEGAIRLQQTRNLADNGTNLGGAMLVINNDYAKQRLQSAPEKLPLGMDADQIYKTTTGKAIESDADRSAIREAVWKAYQDTADQTKDFSKMVTDNPNKARELVAKNFKRMANEAGIKTSEQQQKDLGLSMETEAIVKKAEGDAPMAKIGAFLSKVTDKIAKSVKEYATDEGLLNEYSPKFNAVIEQFRKGGINVDQFTAAKSDIINQMIKRGVSESTISFWRNIKPSDIRRQ